MQDIKSIIEAIIFASDDPVGLDSIKKIISSWDAEIISHALSALEEEYKSGGHGIYLANVAGGYQFRTKPEMSIWITRLKENPPARLSKAALETLAIVAYKQPVMRLEIEEIRGVDVGWIIRQLIEKGLVRIIGRHPGPGRALMYGTTKRFLEIFNLNDISSLPSLEEMEKMDLS